MKKSKAFREALQSRRRERFEIRHGDNLAILKTLNPNSFDSLVTDPPAGIAFMGKDWDTDKGGRDQWIAWLTEVMRECYRVMKPGAYGVVWALPRTSHWTAMALENAGFAVRDCVMHLFGSGFPKSHDISKAIDKEAGAEREVLGTRKAMGSKEGQKAYKHDEHGKSGGQLHQYVDVTAPATEAAKQWNGWGTALKPAYEPWWLIQKPISEPTIAKNVLEHGTGGLNIDASRIGNDTITTSINIAIQGGNFARADGVGKKQEKTQHVGRFPANVIFDEDAAKVLDAQGGVLKSGALKAGHKQGKSAMNSSGGRIEKDYGNDSGGASRFFYVAKPSKSDKGDENGHPTVKSTKLMEYLIKLVTKPGGTVLDPFMGSGTTGVSAIRNDFQFFGIDQEEKYSKLALDRMLGEYRVSDKKLKEQAGAR